MNDKYICCFCKKPFAQFEIPVFLIDDKAGHSKCWLKWRDENDSLTTPLPE
jgi:hypothetical protein